MWKQAFEYCLSLLFHVAWCLFYKCKQRTFKISKARISQGIQISHCDKLDEDTSCVEKRKWCECILRLLNVLTVLKYKRRKGIANRTLKEICGHWQAEWGHYLINLQRCTKFKLVFFIYQQWQFWMHLSKLCSFQCNWVGSMLMKLLANSLLRSFWGYNQVLVWSWAAL